MIYVGEPAKRTGTLANAGVLVEFDETAISKYLKGLLWGVRKVRAHEQ